MQASERKSIDRRLARIEGQVRGVRRLLAEDAYCCDILNQVSAVSSALGQVSAAVASQHIKHCIIGYGTEEAHKATKSMSRDEVLDELDEVFRRLSR
ncbi:MAG: metal-sensitive transcriptional regulator [Armatimonadetes bacterium]|nr:metal-sensitive transcriptional regulator [Armatimonadota bacterium]